MNRKFIIILSLVVLLIIIIIINIYTKFAPLYDEKKIHNISYINNKNRHYACIEKTYGHYSRVINRFPSIFKFPLYYFSHPKTYVVNAGEFIYIPKKWWHWVVTFSTDNSVSYNLAYNYLINSPINNSIPFCGKFADNNEIKKIHNIFNTKIIAKNNPVNLWCDSSYNKNTTIKDFVNDKEKYKDCYFITLKIKLSENEKENDNYKIFEEFKNYIPIPNIIKNTKINNTFFWLNNGNIDTGLHYDDDDGILCVLSGKKIITLYPPEDAKFLYPV